MLRVLETQKHPTLLKKRLHVPYIYEIGLIRALISFVYEISSN